MLDWLALLPICAPAVHPETMSRIVLHESRGRPFAIGVNDKSKRISQPKTKTQAILLAEQLAAEGYNFDVGLGQLNSTNIKKLNISFDEAFDPCANLAHTSKILKDNYSRALRVSANPQQALELALSAYNTGNFSAGFTNGYVKKVLSVKGKKVTESRSAPRASSKPIIISNRSESDNLYNGWL